jgi:hypothetical protein
MTPEQLLALPPAEREALPRHDFGSKPTRGDCTGCISCTDCMSCTDCTDCTDCARCAGCANCTGCADCADCRSISCGKGLRYVAWGVQLTAEQYAQL